MTDEKSFACFSNCRHCADRTQNLEGQPPTLYSECSRFHPNRFTYGGFIAERGNTAKSHPKVNPIFGGSLASSRIIIMTIRKRALNRDTRGLYERFADVVDIADSTEYSFSKHHCRFACMPSGNRSRPRKVVSISQQLENISFRSQSVVICTLSEHYTSIVSLLRYHRIISIINSISGGSSERLPLLRQMSNHGVLYTPMIRPDDNYSYGYFACIIFQQFYYQPRQRER